MHRKIIKTAGLVANTDKTDAGRVLREAVQLFERAGLRVLVEEDSAGLIAKAPSAMPLKELVSQSDVLVVLGGDGTMLRVARSLEGADTPIFGINLGSLGFLTAISQKDMGEAVEKIRKGDFQLAERTMLDVRILRNDQTLASHRALNDAVITRVAFSRLVRIEVTVDGDLLTTYTGDGLIIATPTGSTAYSLSAGGPIIHPGARSFAITPICPHTLSNQSVIVSDESVVRARFLPQSARSKGNQQIECLVAADGQELIHVKPNDAIEARRTAKALRMLTLPGHSYFGVLRHKLHWSGSNV